MMTTWMPFSLRIKGIFKLSIFQSMTASAMKAPPSDYFAIDFVVHGLLQMELVANSMAQKFWAPLYAFRNSRLWRGAL